MHGNSLISAICLCVVYGYIDMRLSNDIFKREVKTANPYLLGISAYMGLIAFDIQGILYGPLLVCMAKISYDVLSNVTIDEQNQLQLA